MQQNFALLFEYLNSCFIAEFYLTILSDEQLPPSYTDIDLNWALPTFDEAVNFEKTHIWTTDKVSIA